MTARQPQLPPLTDLDGIFTLPPSITDEPLRRIYEVLVVRLRRDLRDSLGKDPTTLQLLVTERTAYNYVLIKDKDLHAVGATGGFAHMTAAKEFNAFWLGLAESLNKMMQAGNSEYRDNLMMQVARVINETLAEVVSDPADQAVFRARVSAALASAGA